MKTNMAGKSVKDKNVLLRMFLVVFAGIMAFAVLISWRSQLISASEYVEIPIRRVKKVEPKPTAIQRTTETLKTELENPR